MSKRILRWLTIIIPISFMVAILSLSDMVFEGGLSLVELLSGLGIVSIGATIFSSWVFGFIDRRELEIQRRAAQLEALNQASLALTTELDIDVLLQKVVDISRELVSSRFGALGVLDEHGKRFERFISSGLSIDTRSSIGLPPEGLGVFSVLIRDGEPLLLEDILKHQRSIGFPENHPKMQTLLGVPIKLKGKVIGDLYLADKIQDENFSDPTPGKYNQDDKKILEMFATQAAIAIENANLYSQIQQLAVLEERERFGMDLHDGIIQSIYAVGLMLEDTKKRVSDDPRESKNRISKAIISLNTVITDLRNYIFDLRPQHLKGKNVVEGLEELARSLRVNTLMEVEMDIMQFNPQLLSADQTIEILHIAQEALSNVQRHSGASSVFISLSNNNGSVEMIIKDNGSSIDEAVIKNPSGNGLRNMEERAVEIGGRLEIKSKKSTGTTIHLFLPIS